MWGVFFSCRRSFAFFIFGGEISFLEGKYDEQAFAVFFSCLRSSSFSLCEGRVWHISRVGQNHTFIGMHGVHTIFLAEKLPKYGHIRCRYTVLVNPMYPYTLPVFFFSLWRGGSTAYKHISCCCVSDRTYRAWTGWSLSWWQLKQHYFINTTISPQHCIINTIILYKRYNSITALYY